MAAVHKNQTPETPQRHPLALAATLFVLGVAFGCLLHPAAAWVVIGAAAALIAWGAAEYLRAPRVATVLLGVAILLSGVGVWVLNQESVERGNLVRFAPGAEEVPVTCRVAVLAAGDGAGELRAAQRLVIRAEAVLTERGWRPAAGDVVVTSHTGQALHAGDRAELVGWLSRVKGPSNPGAIDEQAMLAADRIFAQVRIPRASGVTLLSAGDARRAENWLPRAREFLREKLLANIVLDDVPAAYTLTALLLGVRDPVIDTVSQAFSSAGVAHLLAISGSHVVLFTLLVWWVMRFVPLRPRWRDVLIAAMVMGYLLATPCGPPIVRAAIALTLVLLARLSGRPAQHLNTLAAAAILVLLFRPADVASAGFQLSFAATLGLILFAPRLYHLLFDRWIERRTLIAELSQSRWARRRLTAQKGLAGLLVANIIGATTAAPLVAFHFGQVNLWAVPAGVVALPFVMLAMIAAVLQTGASLISTALGLWLGPATNLAGAALVRAVQTLAAVPGAALALRAPPVWATALVYLALLAWALRLRLRLSRALAINGCAAAVVITAGWYACTMPVGALQLTVLDAGEASSILMRTPSGAVWAFNAGTARIGSVEALVRPAMRVAGESRLGGLVVSALDVNHAAGGADLIQSERPAAIFVAAPGWARRRETLAGAGMDDTARAQGITVQPLRAGQIIELGGASQLEILWPPASAPPAAGRTDLIALCSFARQHVLIADPAALSALLGLLRAMPALQCDAVIFTGAPGGAAEAALRAAVAPLHAQAIVWTGTTPGAARQHRAGEWNTQEGALTVVLDQSSLRVSRP